MDVASPPPAKATRKRKRRGESLSEDSDDGSKKRGRPRTEKPDESAADRRRTQIRMAQRAYRQRKETTLDDLRKRVSDLTTTMECMNKAFEDCRDRLVSAGLSEGQLHDIAETTVRFAGFMKSVRRPSESYDEAPVEAEVPIASPPPPAPLAVDINSMMSQVEQLPLPGGKNVPSWLDQAALTHTERRYQRPDIGMGYTIYNVPNTFDQLAENFNIPSLAQSMQPEHHQPSIPKFPFDPSAPDLFHQPSLSLTGELPPPKTYSFQETTLARRLHRACLEAAYLLLLDPSRRPHTYERVFKLSLLSRDRVRMAASLKKILDRGLDEPLDFWDAPLLHIGGAGTHYPERQQQRQRGGGFPQRERPKFHLGVIGPQMLNLLENVVQARPAAEISVEIEGFEGEWFDPYDIEGYLESRGIHIDPTVSFVEAEILDLSPAAESYSNPSSAVSTHSSSGRASTLGINPSATASGTATASSATAAATWDPDVEQWSALQILETDMERWRELENSQVNGLGLGSVGFSDADTGSWTNFSQLQALDQPQQMKGAAMMNFPFDPTGQAGREAGLAAGAGAMASSYGQLALLEPVAEPEKKVVIIDVAKFVKVLTVTGVCLGRTPGFKRKDVDRALAISSFEAF